MEFSQAIVSNFSGSFYGMRNPLNSWDRSDSLFNIGDITDLSDAESEVIPCWICKDKPNIEYYSDEYEDEYQKYCDWLESNGILKNYADIYEYAFIGPNDLALAQRLITSGPEHCKFLRQIQVCVNITAPLYWWKEFDTYKVGTTANSTSTMHTLAKTPITLDCFEIGDYDPELVLESETNDIDDDNWIPHAKIKFFSNGLIKQLEQLRLAYLETKDVRYWKELVRWLPEGFLQTRTVTLSYANLRNIYFQRRNHKLIEWHQFCDWVKELPYAKELITLEGNK